MDFNAYLASVTERLIEDNYDIRYDVSYKGLEFRCVARLRGLKAYKAEFFGSYVEFFFIISRFSTMNFVDLKNYSSKCFRYARRYKLIPFIPFFPLTGYAVFPVAVVDHLDNDTIEAIRTHDPPKHYLAREQLVVYPLDSNRLYFSETNPFWDEFYHNYYRRVACAYLLPGE